MHMHIACTYTLLDKTYTHAHASTESFWECPYNAKVTLTFLKVKQVANDTAPTASEHEESATFSDLYCMNASQVSYLQPLFMHAIISCIQPHQLLCICASTI
jgi:hypothetical protein